MTIHIDTFSAKATFDFKDNELATSGLECAEVVDKDDGDGRFRGQSNPILKKTLVDVHHNLSTLKNVSWLPGVGDIYNGTPGGGGEGIAISHPYESRHCLSPWPSSSLTRRGTPMLDKGRQPEGAKDTRRSALRRHCDFWDADQDGVIYPWDIFITSPYAYGQRSPWLHARRTAHRNPFSHILCSPFISIMSIAIGMEVLLARTTWTLNWTHGVSMQSSKSTPKARTT